MRRIYLRVGGSVQGVGFRYFAVYTARRLGLTGWVHNREDGDLEAEAQGAPDAVDQFAEAMRRGPRYARVDRFELQPLTLADEYDFHVEDW